MTNETQLIFTLMYSDWGSEEVSTSWVHWEDSYLPSKQRYKIKHHINYSIFWYTPLLALLAYQAVIGNKALAMDKLPAKNPLAPTRIATDHALISPRSPSQTPPQSPRQILHPSSPPGSPRLKRPKTEVIHTNTRLKAMEPEQMLGAIAGQINPFDIANNIYTAKKEDDRHRENKESTQEQTLIQKQQTSIQEDEMLKNKQTVVAEQFKMGYEANDITFSLKEMLEMKIKGETITPPSSIIKELLSPYDENPEKEKNSILELTKRFGRRQTRALKRLEITNTPVDQLQKSLDDLNNLPLNETTKAFVEGDNLTDDD